MTSGHSAKFEFVLENGVVEAATRFINPDGSVGGWVANTAKVGEGAYIEQGSIVEPHAIVEPNARIRTGETFPSSRVERRLRD